MPTSRKVTIPKNTFNPLRRVYVIKNGKIHNGKILSVCWKIKDRYWIYELNKKLGWFGERSLYPNRAAIAARILAR